MGNLELVNREAFHYRCPVTGVDKTMAFGYVDNEPVAVIFTEALDAVYIPKAAMYAAHESGWAGDAD